MRTFGTLTIIVLAFTALSARAQQDPKTLPAKAKDELKQMALALSKAKDDAEKEKLAPLLLTWGKAGVEFLETLKAKKEFADCLAVALTDAPSRLGLDIAKKSVDVREAWSTSYFPMDEVVLLKKEGFFGGFMIDSKASTPHEGKIKYKWWRQTDPIAKLTAAGGKSGENEATGVKSAKNMRPNSAFTDYEFDLKIDDAPIVLRFVGPAAFKHKYDGTIGFAYTGLAKFDGIAPTDQKFVFANEYPKGLGRSAKLLQEYLFRIVPGAEPLLAEGADKEAFAQYEQVQVHVRELRPSRDPVVIVWILEPDNVQVAPWHRRYIQNFLNELVPLKDENLLMIGGQAPSMEGNKMWGEKGWEKLSPKAIKLLRSAMPENL